MEINARMARGKCGRRRALFPEIDRKSRITAYYGLLFHQRLRLHSDILPVPDVRTERPLLRKLSNLRLGTFFHVHANALYSHILQLVAVFHGRGGHYSLGIHVDDAP